LDIFTQKKKRPQDCFQSALNFLKIRDHSKFELETKLRKKKYSSNEIKEAINKCFEYKFLDDEKFAKNYFEIEKRKLNGPLKIRAAFYKKGIDNKITDELIAKFQESKEEYKIALKFFFKSKYKIDKKEGYNKKAQTYIRIMSQKGFSRSIVMDIFEHHFSLEYSKPDY